MALDIATLGAALERVLAFAFTHVKGLSRSSDPLASEMAASGILAFWSEQDLPGLRDPAGLLSAAMVDHLEALASDGDQPDAIPLLLGIQAVDRGGSSVDAMLAMHRLGDDAPGMPSWAKLAGKARLEVAWSAADDYGDQDLLVGRFSYEGLAPHDLTVLIDHNVLDIVKDIAVVPASESLRARWEGLPGITVRDVSLQEYSSLLADSLDMLDHTLDPPVSEDVRLLRPFLDARRWFLLRPRPLKRRPVSEAARRRLYKAFRGSVHAVALGKDAGLARVGIDFAADVNGDPLRWSPIVVEIYLADWLPRKVSLSDEDIVALPEVLRAWLRFVGEQRGYDDSLTGEMLAAVDEHELGFAEAMADPALFGPAKSIARLMVADGVDLSEPDAVTAWIDAFNARPLDEREKRIGDPFLD